nr:MAG TPA: hypothetical protein [Caudoviricetes sp.]
MSRPDYQTTVECPRPCIRNGEPLERVLNVTLVNGQGILAVLFSMVSHQVQTISE